jgi:hypothetical protein
MGLRTNEITVDSKLTRNELLQTAILYRILQEAVLCCDLLHITVTSTLHNLYEITKQKLRLEIVICCFNGTETNDSKFGCNSGRRIYYFVILRY